MKTKVEAKISSPNFGFVPDCLSLGSEQATHYYSNKNYDYDHRHTRQTSQLSEAWLHTHTHTHIYIYAFVNW